MKKAAKYKEKLKKAWLIRWGFHGANEDESLRRVGIENKIIDILNSRKTFDDVLEYTKNLYRVYELSLQEKIYLEHYTFGKKRKKDLFKGSVPVFTSYQSDLYRDMMECFRKKGLHSEEYENLLKEWVNYPQYVLVGHNPYLEAKKVYNLGLIKNKDGEATLEWEESLVNGKRNLEKYFIKN